MPRITIFFLAALLAISQPASAAVHVWLDYFSDAGEPDFFENLDAAAVAAGVTPFDFGEGLGIAIDVTAGLEAMYGAYDITFDWGRPNNGLDPYEKIDFGAQEADSSYLGTAALDFMNASCAWDSSNYIANVYTGNFGFVLNEFSGSESRTAQVEQITAALVRVAGHELGHAFGLQHHHAYGTDGILPGNYADTGGLQNAFVIASDTTGLNEAGFEATATLSRMSNLMIEASGGGLVDYGFAGQLAELGFAAPNTLAETVLYQTEGDLGGGDTGNTPGTATALDLTALSISGLDAANTAGELETAGDVDVYSFTIDGPGALWAQVWSDDWIGNDFDTLLQLYDTDGTTLLAENDNIRYDDNTFNSGSLREEDSALLNIALPGPGTYYLKVSNLGPVIGEGEPDNGGFYSLIFGVDVAPIPEPSTLAMALIGMAAIGFWARRRNNEQKRDRN